MNAARESERALASKTGETLPYALPPRGRGGFLAYVEMGVGIIAVVCPILACVGVGVFLITTYGNAPLELLVVVSGTPLAVVGLGCGIVLMLLGRRSGLIAMSMFGCGASLVGYFFLFLAVGRGLTGYR